MKYCIKNIMCLFNRFMLVVIALSLTACGGGSSGGGGEIASPIGDVSGAWFVTETAKNHNCALDPGLKKHTLTVKQSGSSLTIIDDDGNSYSSTLNESKFSWTGSYEEDAPDGTAGRNSLNPMSASVSASCNSLSGTANWTWSATDGSGYSCSGTTNFTASRATATGCGNTVDNGTPPDDGTTPDTGDTQAPTVPVLSASVLSSFQINLSWTPATDNVAVYGYDVYRNGSFLKFVSGTSTASSSLMADTRYCYTVLAKDAAGNKSAQSTQRCAMTDPVVVIDRQAPTVPANLTATAASSSQINLSWSASSDNVAVTSYNIYRNGSYIKTVVGTTSYSDNSGLTASTNYCYRVNAIDAAGNASTQSAQVCTFTQDPAVTIPSAPSYITASNITYNSAKITWTDNSGNETEFEIGTCSGLIGSTGTYTFCSSGFTPVATTGLNTYTLTSLQSSRLYSYYVRAVNTAGASGNRQVEFTTAAVATESTLKITNNLEGIGSTRVLQLRLETVKADATNNANELLSGDGCYYLGPESIDPGEWASYTITESASASGYYVFVGLGIADGSGCSRGWFKKKMWTTDANFNLIYIYNNISLPANLTNGKDVELRLGYSGSDLVIRVYSDGVYNTMINFAASYTDPTP